MLNLKNNSYCSRNSKNKNMTYGIVGLGRFGSALAMDLASAGAEIVVMDKNEERVRTLREMTTLLQIWTKKRSLKPVSRTVMPPSSALPNIWIHPY